MWIKYLNNNNQEALMQIFGVIRDSNNLWFKKTNTISDWSTWGNIDINTITEDFARKIFNQIEKAITENKIILDLTKI